MTSSPGWMPQAPMAAINPEVLELTLMECLHSKASLQHSSNALTSGPPKKSLCQAPRNCERFPLSSTRSAAAFSSSPMVLYAGKSCVRTGVQPLIASFFIKSGRSFQPRMARINTDGGAEKLRELFAARMERPFCKSPRKQACRYLFKNPASPELRASPCVSASSVPIRLIRGFSCFFQNLKNPFREFERFLEIIGYRRIAGHFCNMAVEVFQRLLQVSLRNCFRRKWRVIV